MVLDIIGSASIIGGVLYRAADVAPRCSRGGPMRNAARSERGVSSLNGSVFRAGLGACLAILMAAAAWAQAPVGTISGTLHDQSDAVLPHASVTVRHIATGVERHLTTGGDGTFSAPALAAGEYTVIAVMDGFRTLQRDVTVATGQVLTVDLRMELG